MSLYPNIFELKPNQLLTFYLTSSFLYYKENKAVLSDGDYDLLCSRLYNKFEEVTHPHKVLVDKEALIAGTGYGLQDYPNRVKGAALAWYDEWEKSI